MKFDQENANPFSTQTKSFQLPRRRSSSWGMSRLPDRPSGGESSSSEKFRAGATPSLPERPRGGRSGQFSAQDVERADTRFAAGQVSRPREREERRRSRSRTPPRKGAGWRRNSRSLSPPRGYRGDPRNFNPNYRGRPQVYRRESTREQRRSRSRSPGPLA